MNHLSTFRDFVNSYLSRIHVNAEKNDEECKVRYRDVSKLLRNKLKELRIKRIDIVIFLNCVHHGLTYKEVAKELGISIYSVQYRLTKVRKRFPELRTFNRNSTEATDRPTRYSSDDGFTEVNGMDQFNSSFHSHAKGSEFGNRIKRVF